MQHGHVLEIRAQVDGDSDGSASLLVDREQRLHVRVLGDAHAQELLFCDDLRRAVALDRGDDAMHDAALTAVEEKQALERAAMFVADSGPERYGFSHASPCASRPPALSRAMMLAGPSSVESATGARIAAAPRPLMPTALRPLIFLEFPRTGGGAARI